VAGGGTYCGGKTLRRLPDLGQALLEPVVRPALGAVELPDVRPAAAAARSPRLVRPLLVVVVAAGAAPRLTAGAAAVVETGIAGGGTYPISRVGPERRLVFVMPRVLPKFLVP
jgi:NAD(P)H-dependent flavin oxidoreductase YrpB (nitropropane dioxygenase family)